MMGFRENQMRQLEKKRDKLVKELLKIAETACDAVAQVTGQPCSITKNPAPEIPKSVDKKKGVEENPSPVPPMSHEEKVASIHSHFGASPEEKPDGKNLLGRHPGTPCSAIDLKCLFTRLGQVRWPNGCKVTKEEVKAMVKGLYGVDSGKDLYEHEVDFLYEQFGRVLAGRAELALDDEGTPIIATKEPK